MSNSIVNDIPTTDNITNIPINYHKGYNLNTAINWSDVYPNKKSKVRQRIIWRCGYPQDTRSIITIWGMVKKQINKLFETR